MFSFDFVFSFLQAGAEKRLYLHALMIHMFGESHGYDTTSKAYVDLKT
jgi:hypothetical protein